MLEQKKKHWRKYWWYLNTAVRLVIILCKCSLPGSDHCSLVMLDVSISGSWLREVVPFLQCLNLVQNKVVFFVLFFYNWTQKTGVNNAGSQTANLKMVVQKQSIMPEGEVPCSTAFLSLHFLPLSLFPSW